MLKKRHAIIIGLGLVGMLMIFPVFIQNCLPNQGDGLLFSILDNNTPSNPSLAAPQNVTVTAGNAQTTITWDSVTDATSYNLYWSTSSGVTVSAGTKISGVISPYNHVGLTNGTTYYYIVTAENSGGEGAASAEVSAVLIPNAPTGVVADPDDIAVSISWTAAAGATSYNIYWATTSGVTKASPNIITNATNPYIHTPVTNGTTYYYIVTAINAGGESSASTEASAKPNLIGTGTPVVTDIGASFTPITSSNGNEPSIGIDTVNNKLFFAVENMENNGRLGLFRCNLDGSNCSLYDVSNMAGTGNDSGSSPALVVDNDNGFVYIVTENWDTAVPVSESLWLYRCDVEMTGCIDVDVTGLDKTGDEPSIILANNKVYMASHFNTTIPLHPLLISTCNLDLTGCVATVESADNKGWTPEIVFDSVSSKILVVTRDASNSNKARLFRCSLDLTDCNGATVGIDISVSQGVDSGHFPVINVDYTNNKILVVTRDATSSRPSLVRCNLDGSSCSQSYIGAVNTAGILGTEGWTDSVVDNVNGKLLVVTHNAANSGRPTLFRCDLDGTNCTSTDLSNGGGLNCGYAPSIIIDWFNNMLLVVTEDNSKTPPSPSLFRN